MLQTKTCSDCKIDKQFAEFTQDKRSTTGITCRCKACTKIKLRLWYEENQEKVKAKKREEYQPKEKVVLPHLFEEAKAIGAELIGEHPKAGYGLYKLQCGHVAPFRYKHVRDNNISCRTCIDEEAAMRAMYIGLTLNFNNEKTSKGYRNYTFPCGHIRDLRTVHVAVGNFKCKICQELRNKKTAEENDLCLLGCSSSSDPNYRSYILPCGCVRDIKIANVGKGNWICRSCNITYFHRKSNIYLIRFKTSSFSWLKLGFSYAVEDRIRDYQISEPFSSEVVFIKEINNGQNAMLMEKEIHKRLRQLRLPKELMKTFHIKSGYTECYELGSENLITIETQKVLQEYGKETEN